MIVAKKNILITGILGNLGSKLAERISSSHSIIGLDRRATKIDNKYLTYSFDIRQKRVEKLFSENKIDTIIHLNIMHDLRKTQEEHYSFNVMGTDKLLKLAKKHGVKKFILLSSANVYGPRSENPQFINEDHPLLGASGFDAIDDLVEMDMTTSNYFWKAPEMDIVILRPCHIIGNLKNAPTRYLKLKSPITLLGFNPMIQVIHEEDLLSAIELCIENQIKGIFNISSEVTISLKNLLKKLKRSPVPLPEFFAKSLLKKLWAIHYTNYPPPELSHLKYTCMVDSSNFKKSTNFKPDFHLQQIVDFLK